MANIKRKWFLEFPHLLEDWNYSKNSDPANFGINQKAWWICKNGHEWLVQPNNRVGKYSGKCPICAKKIVGENHNFAILYPNLLKEWNFDKNQFDPKLIMPHSGKKAWWICKNKHEWEASINGRTKGFNCPYCCGHKATFDNNITLYPQVKEFNLSRNKTNPLNLTPGSNKKVWWVCKSGHEYFSRISDRIKKNSGCPYCNTQSSAFEIRVYAELKKLFNNVKWRFKINKLEIDVFLPDLSIGVEVDGYYWHKDKVEKDYKKTKTLKALGTNIIRLREIPLLLLGDCDIGYIHNKNQLNVLKKLVQKIGKIKNINVSDYLNTQDFQNTLEYTKILSESCYPTNSITLYPELVKQWHPIKNGSLKPENVSYGSDKSIWWICEDGHEWIAAAKTRTNGHNCLVCYKNNPRLKK